MTSRYILVSLLGSDGDTAALRLALQLGRRLEAHVEALHARADPRASLAVVGPGTSGALVQDMLNAAEQEVTARAAAARSCFEAETEGVPKAESAAEHEGFSAALRVVDGRHAEVVARRGRLADLVVAARPADRDDVDAVLTLETALFEAGRPLLVVPPGQDAISLSGVAIAWDGSVEAARAVGGALPIMALFQHVTVLSVAEDGKLPVDPEDLVRALAWRGIAAAAHRVDSDRGAIGVALLAGAAENGCDILVMGGYGHSRLRELVLGGATRDALSATAMPVLMSH